MRPLEPYLLAQNSTTPKMSHQAAGSTSSRSNHSPRNAQYTSNESGGVGGGSRFAMVHSAILAPFTRSQPRSDSARILSDLAPVIMTPRMMNAAANTLQRPPLDSQQMAKATHNIGFASLGRAPLRLSFGSRRITSHDLQIVEATDELLVADIPEPDGVALDVSLIRGFNATNPNANANKTRRRKTRNVQAPYLGLKEMGMSARGILREEGSDGEKEHQDNYQDPRKAHPSSRKPRESLAASVTLGREELSRQKEEIILDKENLAVRRALVNGEIQEITHKITALDAIRNQLEQDLLRLHEEELELDDELEGIHQRSAFEESQGHLASTISSRNPRKKRNFAFLPSEHDELPHGVAFMTLAQHTAPITAVDFSEPYGMLVSTSQDESARCWDLCTGEEIARLTGHSGLVKCVQVEGTTCVTGGSDSTIRVWDLRKAGSDSSHSSPILGEIPELVDYPDVPGEPESYKKHQLVVSNEPCVRVLEGHSKAVSTIYYEDSCLVSGASDKTIRQWDLSTGQCILTMDILWAISHPPSLHQSASRYAPDLAYGVPPASLMNITSSNFAVPTPPLSDGSWEMYQDFVGAVQFWGYALVSGSGDGAVRMWDMRTGQAHRTLLGHTGPITCLQFDELHVVSGSLDKSIRIWDLRTGGISETIRYDFPISALQFDSRKVVSATGENGVKIYNRTTMQHSTLSVNGHTRPVERLRYMDRYLVSGARDHTVKIWAL